MIVASAVHRGLFAATAATVAIDPSFREQLDRSGHESNGASKRIETQTSSDESDHPSQTAEQCRRHVGIMRRYYEPGRRVYAVSFGALRFVLSGLGISRKAGEIARLALVQEATRLTWSDLDNDELEETSALLRDDKEFVRWQPETFPPQLVGCNARWSPVVMRRLLGVEVQRSGQCERITGSLGGIRRRMGRSHSGVEFGTGVGGITPQRPDPARSVGSDGVG